MIFTTLHSGGKFRKTDKDAAYRIAGGLHGVGVCVSQRAVDPARSRSQTRWRRVSHRVRRQRQGQGAAEEDRHRRCRATPARACASGRTRSISIRRRSSPADIAALLRAKAMLLPGVQVHAQASRRTGKIERADLAFSGRHQGLFRIGDCGLRTGGRTFFGERYIAAQSESDSFAEGEGALWAIAWTPDGELVTESYVNMIPTRHGGTHVSGLREGVYNAIKNFIDLHAMGQRGLKVVPGGRVVARLLRAGGEDARSAVQGPGQERADLARRGEAHRADGARPVRAVAQPACRRRQAHRRARHPPGHARARAPRRRWSGAKLPASRCCRAS